jgi:hypothetical protein
MAGGDTGEYDECGQIDPPEVNMREKTWCSEHQGRTEKCARYHLVFNARVAKMREEFEKP